METVRGHRFPVNPWIVKYLASFYVLVAMKLLCVRTFAFMGFGESHRRHMGTEERFEQEYLEYLQFFVQ